MYASAHPGRPARGAKKNPAIAYIYDIASTPTLLGRGAGVWVPDVSPTWGVFKDPTRRLDDVYPQLYTTAMDAYLNIHPGQKGQASIRCPYCLCR